MSDWGNYESESYGEASEEGSWGGEQPAESYGTTESYTQDQGSWAGEGYQQETWETPQHDYTDKIQDWGGEEGVVANWANTVHQVVEFTGDGTTHVVMGEESHEGDIYGLVADYGEGAEQVAEAIEDGNEVTLTNVYTDENGVHSEQHGLAFE